MEIMDARGVGSKHVGGSGKWYPCLYCNRLSHFEGMMLVALLRYQMFHSSKATQLISHHVKCTFILNIIDHQLAKTILLRIKDVCVSYCTFFLLV